MNINNKVAPFSNFNVYNILWLTNIICSICAVTVSLSYLVISVSEKKAGLAPRMAYIKGRPIDAHKPAVKKANKESFSSSPVMNCPPLTSSGQRISCKIT